ncbi:hypothetical protein [Bradyrhizobium sp. CCGB20]|uniref:hypothetical protein n=1 Tax=unclassified Bradyrhizobium TaxID=2631580 RepID=UPI0035C6C53B
MFLAQRMAAMVDQGHTNRIRMANRAINEYQQYLDEREDRIHCGEDVSPSAMNVR